MSTTTIAAELNAYTSRQGGFVPKCQTKAAGQSTAEFIMDAMIAAHEAGYERVGNGSASGEIIYLPTCSSKGFAGRRELIYFSRFQAA